MSDRKIYSHDDFISLTTKAIKAINDKLKEANKDIILLTDEEYKKIFKKLIEEFDNEDRCMAIYLSGKKQGERCHAAPHPGTKFCVKHQNQGRNIMKNYELNPELDPDFVKKAVEAYLKSENK